MAKSNKYDLSILFQASVLNLLIRSINLTKFDLHVLFGIYSK